MMLFYKILLGSYGISFEILFFIYSKIFFSKLSLSPTLPLFVKQKRPNINIGSKKNMEKIKYPYNVKLQGYLEVF